MGCSECGLMQKLIRAEGLSICELTGVDIDGVVLQCNMYKLKPLMMDYLKPSREHQLTVRLYQGLHYPIICTVGAYVSQPKRYIYNALSMPGI